MIKFERGDRVYLVHEWDDMDWDLQEFVGNGVSYTVHNIDEEDQTVLLEFDFYNEDEDETYYDTYWIPIECLKKKVVVDVTLSEADLKYRSIVLKIRSMQAKRKGEGYAY